jgi:hypothetical protein
MADMWATIFWCCEILHLNIMMLHIIRTMRTLIILLIFLEITEPFITKFIAQSVVSVFCLQFLDTQ